MTQEENYTIKERSIILIKEHGTVEKALSFLNADLNEMESMWSYYSCDSLGHGITCTRLLISYLETNHPKQ
jgi:hypothetical protein